MSFLQKLKQLLPVRSGSFYSQMSELDSRLRDIQLRIAEMQSAQNSLHSQALTRQAFLLDQLLPDFISDASVEDFDRKLGQPRGDRPEIPVVFITDSQYLVPAMTAASSLFRHASQKVCYSVHVIGHNLSEEEVEKYSVLSPAVHFRRIDRDFSLSGKTHIWVSPAAMLKFELPDLFPQYDKILYLDSDVLIYEDLSELYHTDLSNCYAAVVKDKVAMELEGHHTKMNHQAYFNSGMMLLDLKKMREEGISAKLLEDRKNDPSNHFMDQDVFNRVFREKVKYVSPTYNFMLGNLLQINSDIVKTGEFYRIPLQEMKRIFCRPAVQHFSNLEKPWFSPLSVDYERWHLENLYLNKILERRGGHSS